MVTHGISTLLTIVLLRETGYKSAGI